MDSYTKYFHLESNPVKKNDVVLTLTPALAVIRYNTVYVYQYLTAKYGIIRPRVNE
jgi:hypothetical protein